MQSNIDFQSNEPTTASLEKILKSVNSDIDALEFIRRYTNGSYKSFAEYFNSYVITKELDYHDIMKRSNINKNYYYNIINGDRNPKRDKIIALCIAAGMHYDEINRALKIAKEGVLYPKVERDARIIIAVNNRIDSVSKINEILEREGLELIK